MPKKFTGENSKAAGARERRAASKNEAALKKQQQQEDEYWRDDDKHAAKKQNRKEEAERKKHEQQQKRLEKEALIRSEESAVDRQCRAKQSIGKVTRAQVDAERRRIEESSRKSRSAASSRPSAETQPPLPENVNRAKAEGAEARSVEEAIAVLRVDEEPEADRHPERRMKAAFKSFEEENLQRMRSENPGMRLAQVRNMLMKEWEKSPNNPMNQAYRAYNSKS